MTVAETAKQPRVVLCGCVYSDIILRATREQILAGLRGNGVTLEVVPDLCGLAANRDPRLRTWADASPLTVVACFSRAIRWLFHAAGVTLNGQARLFNMRAQSPEKIVAQISNLGSQIADPGCGANPQSEIIKPQSGGWVPWFPVIDYNRCRNCKQCLNFCLFGVYALSDEGRVEVRKPAGCKTNCPACARVCPNQAIIFPKYAEPHINGDEIPDQVQVGQPAPAGDILETIRRRGAGRKRFAKQADGQSAARSCPTLDSLRRELGIPEDVLTSLSPSELQRITAKSQGNSGQSSSRPADAGRKDTDHDG